MINITAVTQDTWFISYNADKSVIHYGEATTGTCINSGQVFQDPLYYNEVDWLVRLAELGVDPEELAKYNDI